MNRATNNATVGLTVRLMQLAKMLKAYYDQHQAQGCKCSLCQQVELVCSSLRILL
jgi:hypothetical protein